MSLSGPISDTLGFTLNANFDEFEGPDEWVTSEGLPVGGESTDFVTGKLKFAPNDFFDMEVRMSYLRTDDQLTTEGLYQRCRAGALLEFHAAEWRFVLPG